MIKKEFVSGDNPSVMEAVMDIHDLISKVESDLRQIKRLVETVCPRPTNIQELAHKLNKEKEKSRIDSTWLKSHSISSDGVAEAQQRLEQENSNPLILATHFLVTFPTNPGLTLGSTSEEVNGVIFTVAGFHPRTRMPIVSVHGNMTAGTIASNLAVALSTRNGFDGNVVIQDFDVQQWRTMAGLWAAPAIEQHEDQDNG